MNPEQKSNFKEFFQKHIKNLSEKIKKIFAKSVDEVKNETKQNEVNKDPDIEEFNEEIDSFAIEYADLGKERVQHIIRVAAVALRIFLEKESYGNPEKSSRDRIPGYWTYTRFLTWDLLRARFGHGETEYASHNFSDRFIQDLTDKAHEIKELLPEDITLPEWYLFVKVCSFMLMRDPFLIKKGFITETAREFLKEQTRQIGPTDDHYHANFTQWVEMYSTGLRSEGKLSLEENTPRYE